EHAHSMTVHKSQGSQYERVIVLAKESRSLDRNLIYTALTRAKKQAVFIGNKQVFYQALDKSNASKRMTKLAQHLASCFSPSLQKTI
ncbi:MAG: ATP-binding domain-containing protein, partial [Paraglaciecola chathamensis]